MFRTGPNGFNVPYGNYKNPEIMNKTHLDQIHNLIQGVQFECCDYRVALQRISTDVNDYVYLDPPYFPETKTSFTGYTEKGFSLADHMDLFAGIHALTEKNKKIMMSNADVGEVRGSFGESKYTIRSILCKRAINSKNPETKTNEVIITNY
jgi:DNA adenine methylase